MADKALEVILRLRDELFQKGLQTAEKQVASFGQKFSNIGQQAGIAFLGLATAVGGLSKTFADFESSMSSVSTLVDTSKESMAKMSDEVLELSKRTPLALSDLTMGLYDVRSAGISSADAMNVLEQSAKLGVAGLGSTKESVDLMTSALNGFANENLTAEQIANIFFETVKVGKTTIAELSESFGATAPIVHAAGVSLADFSAATAALTTVGLPASESQNSLRAAIVSMKKPTEEMQEIFKKLGVESGPELIRTSGGLGEAFKKIYETAISSGIAIEKATGRVEGAVAITSLATATNKVYTDTLKEMALGSNVVDAAFQKQNATFGATIQRTINSLQALAIQIGQGLVPALTVLANGIKNISDWFASLPAPMKGFIANGLLVATAVTGIVAGVGLLVGGLAGFVSSILGVITAMGGWTVVSGAVTTALTAVGTFLSGLIIPITATVAAVAALAVAWNTNFLGIQTTTFKVAKTIQLIWEDLTVAMSFAAQAFYQQFKTLFQLIPAIVNGVFKSVGTTAQNLFNGLIDFAKGIFQTVANAVAGWASVILQGLKSVGGGVNFILQSLGQSPIDFGGMLTAVKSATDFAVSYVQLKWKEAGTAINSELQKSQIIKPATPVNTAPGKTAEINSIKPDKSGKSAAAKEQKAEKDRLKTATDLLTNSLNANKLAYEETVSKMGAYATEAEKLSAEIVKLEADHRSLIAAQVRLQQTHLTGDAEKQRIKNLTDIGEKIKQNAIDEENANQQLAKLKINLKLEDTLKADQQAMDDEISKMSVFANAGVKLGVEIQKLKKDEEALQAARAEIAKQPGSEEARLAALKEVDDKIKQNAVDEKKIQKDLAKFNIDQGRATLDAEFALSQEKEKIQNDYQKRQEDHELRGLQSLLQRKIISEKQYNEQVAEIQNAQGQRQIDLIDAQIIKLQEKKVISEAINGVTAESLNIEQQILDLQAQQTQIKQDNENAQQEAAANTAASNPFSVSSFLDSVQQSVEQFNQTFVQGIVNGNLNVAQSFRSLAIDIGTSMETKAFNGVAQAATTFAKGLLNGNTKVLADMLKNFSAFGLGVAQVFSGVGHFIGGVFNNIVDFALKSFSALFDAQKLAAVKGAVITANESAMRAYDAVVGIPVVGPFLAPAAYATTLAFQLAKAAIIGAVSLGFAEGTPELPHDMVANVHAGEMIIPATFAQAIRAGDLSLSGGNNQAQAAQPASVVQISFEGANFNGVPTEWVDEIERLLISKQKLRGSALFGS